MRYPMKSHELCFHDIHIVGLDPQCSIVKVNIQPSPQPQMPWCNWHCSWSRTWCTCPRKIRHSPGGRKKSPWSPRRCLQWLQRGAKDEIKNGDVTPKKMCRGVFEVTSRYHIIIYIYTVSIKWKENWKEKTEKTKGWKTEKCRVWCEYQDVGVAAWGRVHTDPLFCWWKKGEIVIQYPANPEN